MNNGTDGPFFGVRMTGPRDIFERMYPNLVIILGLRNKRTGSMTDPSPYLVP